MFHQNGHRPLMAIGFDMTQAIQEMIDTAIIKQVQIFILNGNIPTATDIAKAKETVVTIHDNPGLLLDRDAGKEHLRQLIIAIATLAFQPGGIVVNDVEYVADLGDEDLVPRPEDGFFTRLQTDDESG
jgi:hypothetical protein